MKFKLSILLASLLSVACNVAYACHDLSLVCSTVLDKSTCNKAYQYHNGKPYNCNWKKVDDGSATWYECKRSNSSCGLTAEADETDSEENGFNNQFSGGYYPEPDL